jgi:hypothetical protein
VYLATPEGIMASYKQVEDLWKIARAAGRSIHIASRYLPWHYGNSSLLNFCNIFAVPPTLTCTNRTIYDMAKDISTCKMVNSKKITVWYNQPALYGLPNTTRPDSNIDFSTVNCLAGFIHAGTISARRSPRNFPRHDLHDSYHLQLPILLKVLQHTSHLMSNKNGTYDRYLLVVFHWRRGDQLETRCNSSRKEQILDSSVNCGTVKEFTNAANNAFKKITTSKTDQNIIRYVATNENNATDLQFLRNNGFILFSALHSELLKVLDLNLFPLNNLNVFLLEILLMCYADHFFRWGFSEVHNFVQKCRADRYRLKNSKLSNAV